MAPCALSVQGHSRVSDSLTPGDSGSLSCTCRWSGRSPCYPHAPVCWRSGLSLLFSFSTTTPYVDAPSMSQAEGKATDCCRVCATATVQSTSCFRFEGDSVVWNGQTLAARHCVIKHKRSDLIVVWDRAKRTYSQPSSQPHSSNYNC